jgi:hypothetical protein
VKRRLAHKVLEVLGVKVKVAEAVDVEVNLAVVVVECAAH